MEHSDLKVATVWTNIDQTPEPRSFIQFLDALNSTGWLQAHRHRTLASLDIHEGVHLLDVGCGTGADARMVAQQVGPTGKVVGVDPSATMITEAQKRTEGLRLPVEFRSGSVYALPLADGTFDGCYSFLTFDILEHPQKALAEIIRVTRSGGQVVLSAPDHGTLIIDAPNRAVTRAILNFWCDSVHSGWIGRQLPGFYKEAGLQDVTVVPDTFTFTSTEYPLVKQLILQPLVAGAQAAGIVSATDAENWLGTLDEAHQAGRFFSSSIFFIVSGRKP